MLAVMNRVFSMFQSIHGLFFQCVIGQYKTDLFTFSPDSPGVKG